MASIFLDFERSIGASPSAVRDAVRSTLHDLGFELTTDQVTLLEARRGARFGGSLLGASKMPVAISATITPDGERCRLVVHLSDHAASPVGRTWGMNTSYQTIFGEVQERVDHALTGLDPQAARQFAPAEFTSKTGTIGVLESTNRVQSSVASTATGRLNQMLSGGPATRVPEAWKKLDTVVFTSDEGAARMDLQELQAHLAVAMFITTQPGSMPPALTAQVTAFATRVETALNQGGAARYLEIPISDAEEPVVEFLHQQARLREMLPVRTLHRCRTCKFEKITNPDYERLQKRNSRLRALGGSVGASFGKSGVSPFILVGTLFRFAKLDPDYVCPRCQGIDAEAFVVTFCPGCGALRSEAALRVCDKCKLDLRTRLTHDEVWQPYPDPPAPGLAAPPLALPGGTSAAAATPAGGSARLPSGALQDPGGAGLLPGNPMPLPGSALPVPGSTAQPHGVGQPSNGAAPRGAGGPAPPAGQPVGGIAASTAPPPPPPPPPLTMGPGKAAGGPRRGPHGGKVCDGCGAEFASLYRAVVDDGGGRRERFLCGQPPRCNPISLVQPVRV